MRAQTRDAHEGPAQGCGFLQGSREGSQGPMECPSMAKWTGHLEPRLGGEPEGQSWSDPTWDQLLAIRPYASRAH